MPTEDDLASHLKHLEETLLNQSTRRNRDEVSRHLTDDFREFGSSGRTFNKAEILDLLATEPSARLSLSDFRCHQLGPAVALVNYRSQRSTNLQPPTRALRSSLWVLRDNRWQMLFHQGTRA